MISRVDGASPFPFAVDRDGAVALTAEPDLALRARVLQVLFTAPGERVNHPEFGCGLLDLVFEGNDQILVAAAEFSIGQALMRWLGEEIVVNRVNVVASEENMLLELAYTKRADLVRQTVRVFFK